MKNVMVLFLLLAITACAGVATIGAGCEVYRFHRVEMPDPAGVPSTFLTWFNLLDTGMLKVCKGG